MDKTELLDEFIIKELRVITGNAPPNLEEATVHAVLGGGGRVRPALTLAVVRALSGTVDNVALGAASAVELIHCASLVHDDMPCFDNAETRRGKPSVHKKFGEPIALLTGDGLIAGAFEVLSRNAALHPRFSEMVQVLARAVGASDGLVSGQAWEDRPGVSVATVHDRKTGALFEAATIMGALTAGADTAPWRTLGRALGAAYQAADDLLDAAGQAEIAGKPVLQDQRRVVASRVTSEGLLPAALRFHELAEAAARAVPDCAGRNQLIALVRKIADRLCPAPLAIAAQARGRAFQSHEQEYNRASM